MKRYTRSTGRLLAATVVCLSISPAYADAIFVTNQGSTNTIGEYLTSGATVNAALISGLNVPTGIAVSGSNLFVGNSAPVVGIPTIGEYTTSGATVNSSLITGVKSNDVAVSGSDLFIADPNDGTIKEFTTSGSVVNLSLISGLANPTSIAVSGSDLFVVSASTIGEYTTSGATVNASLISDPRMPFAIAVSGSDLFITELEGGTVGEYTTSGVPVNAALINGGLAGPTGIAVSGSDLFIVESRLNIISEYTTSGTKVNGALISGLDTPYGLAIVPTAATVPESSSFTLLGFGLAVLGFCLRRKRVS